MSGAPLDDKNEKLIKSAAWPMREGVVRTPIAFSRALHWWIFSTALLVAGVVRGADTRPVVGPGATKEEAINAYGWPTGQSRLGGKEILNYPQGSITLADGKVERVDFSPNVTWAPPKPRPAPASPTSAKHAEPAVDPWATSFADAATEAAKRRSRILAAFTGSDWSPPSRRFLDEVATHPDFVNAFTGDFVFLKLDFPTRVAQPAELKKQNEELRAHCAVTTYPALIVLSPRGDPVAVVDLTKERTGDNYRAQVMAAVGEVRDLLKQKPMAAGDTKVAVKPPAASAAATASAAAGTKSADDGGQRGMVGAVVSSASWALAVGLGGGALLAVALVWWVWRSRIQMGEGTGNRPKVSVPNVRRSDVPSVTEFTTWPVETVRLLVVALFEATGYKARRRPPGGDADLELLRAGHTTPSVLVCCRPGAAGPVGAKTVRELFGTLVSESVEAGWVIAPGGFSGEARAFAAERGIELIDAEGLIERLHALDSTVLAQVLGRAGA